MPSRDIFLKITRVSPEELAKLHALLLMPKEARNWHQHGTKILSVKWMPDTSDAAPGHAGTYTVEVRVPIDSNGVRSRNTPNEIFDALGIYPAT